MTIARPLRVPIAREQLRQRLALNAGVDPGSGYFRGDARLDPEFAGVVSETDDERQDRLEYLGTFRERAVQEIAGLMGGSHIRVWRGRDGSLEIADPLWADRRFFDQNGEADDLYFERDEWETLLRTRHPDETADQEAGSASIDQPATTMWTVQQMTDAIANCPIQNRDKAWREDFGLRRDEHGWGNEAFRQLWSTARGTKGLTGRPSKAQ